MQTPAGPRTGAALSSSGNAPDALRPTSRVSRRGFQERERLCEGGAAAAASGALTPAPLALPLDTSAGPSTVGSAAAAAAAAPAVAAPADAELPLDPRWGRL